MKQRKPTHGNTMLSKTFTSNEAVPVPRMHLKANAPLRSRFLICAESIVVQVNEHGNEIFSTTYCPN